MGRLDRTPARADSEQVPGPVFRCCKLNLFHENTDPRVGPGGPMSLANDRSGSTNMKTVAEKRKTFDLSIHQVTDMLQIPAGTLRNWQDRYGLFKESSQRGTYRRLYNLTEICQMDSIHRLVQTGSRPRMICVMDPLEIQHLIVAEKLSPQCHQQFQNLVSLLKEKKIDAFTRSLSQIPFTAETCEFVVEPLFRWSGDEWRAGRCTIAEEHEITQHLRDWLTRAVKPVPVSSSRIPMVVLGTPGSDLHEGGILILRSLLSRAGIPVKYLGSAIPAEEFLAFENAANVRAFLVSMTTTPQNERGKAIKVFEQLRTRVAIGGLKADDIDPLGLKPHIQTLPHFSVSRFGELFIRAVGCKYW